MAEYRVVLLLSGVCDGILALHSNKRLPVAHRWVANNVDWSVHGVAMPLKQGAQAKIAYWQNLRCEQKVGLGPRAFWWRGGELSPLLEGRAWTWGILVEGWETFPLRQPIFHWIHLWLVYLAPTYWLPFWEERGNEMKGLVLDSLGWSSRVVSLNLYQCVFVTGLDQSQIIRSALTIRDPHHQNESCQVLLESCVRLKSFIILTLDILCLNIF